MNMVEIININGNKTSVSGIYYISHNNYYFIYTKKEQDNDNHIIFYIVKILQELVNGVNGPSPTGYLIGLKINDDNEYNLVKCDITNIVSDKENNTESSEDTKLWYIPEIEYDKVDKVRGMDIIFVTTAKTDEEGRELLRLFNMPFAK